jgi:hypothetical protein
MAEAPLDTPVRKTLELAILFTCIDGKTRRCDPERNIHQQALINCPQVSG